MIRLHDYWRSSAGYRVRIALNLKGLSYERVTHDLRTGGQHTEDFLALNPQGLVPALEVDGHIVTQSPAIMEWIEESFPHPPILPAGSIERSIVRAMAALICTDIHPINNLRVINDLRHNFAADDIAVNHWIARWIGEGFQALETLVARHGGVCTYGDMPSIADCCLIPQLYAAERFKVDLSPYPRLRAIGVRFAEHAAFAAAHPDRQSDAPAE